MNGVRNVLFESLKREPFANIVEFKNFRLKNHIPIRVYQ